MNDYLLSIALNSIEILSRRQSVLAIASYLRTLNFHDQDLRFSFLLFAFSILHFTDISHERSAG